MLIIGVETNVLIILGVNGSLCERSILGAKPRLFEPFHDKAWQDQFCGGTETVRNPA